MIIAFKISIFYIPYQKTAIITILGYTDLLSLFGCRMLINIKEAVGKSLTVNMGSDGRAYPSTSDSSRYVDGGSSGYHSTVIETIEFIGNPRDRSRTATDAGAAD